MGKLIELIAPQNDRAVHNSRILPIGTIGEVLYETIDKLEYCVHFIDGKYKQSVLVGQEKCADYDLRAYKPVFGKTYKGMGVCGMTDGEEVTGVFTEFNLGGAILINHRNIPCLVNAQTLKNF